MIYLDYSATTKVNEEVLNTYNKVCLDYFGNANSLHKLGVDARKILDSSSGQISDILKVEKEEIIYTSGASEANSLAIIGSCLKYQNRGKHIVTTDMEHPSVYGPLDFLKKLGFKVDYVKTNNGLVDIDELDRLISDETVLVTINLVNSETGVKQDLDKIIKVIKKNNRCLFHSDMTQAIGKINVDLSGVDLVSFSAHKFYGMKGIGCLIKKKNILLEPIIGGKDEFRSGTIPLPLIVSMAKALRISYENINNNVLVLNKKIRECLSKYDGVVINSNDYSIPHILNFSLLNIKPETFLHALEEDEIYISTKSACSSKDNYSKIVLNLTNNMDYAMHSLRVSLSYLTTDEEINLFLNSFDKHYKKLNIK